MSGVGDQDAGVGGGAGGSGDVDADPLSGSGQDPVGDKPANVKDGHVASVKEKHTPEGIVPDSRLLF